MTAEEFIPNHNPKLGLKIEFEGYERVVPLVGWVDHIPVVVLDDGCLQIATGAKTTAVFYADPPEEIMSRRHVIDTNMRKKKINE